MQSTGNIYKHFFLSKSTEQLSRKALWFWNL